LISTVCHVPLWFGSIDPPVCDSFLSGRPVDLLHRPELLLLLQPWLVSLQPSIP
jgi:hypothetical protein